MISAAIRGKVVGVVWRVMANDGAGDGDGDLDLDLDREGGVTGC